MFHNDEAEVDGEASSDEEDEEGNLDSLIDDSSLRDSMGGHRALLAAQELHSARPKNKRIRRGGVLRAAMNHTGDAEDFEAAYMRGDLASPSSGLASATPSSRYADTDDSCSPFGEDIHSTPGFQPRTSPYFRDDIVSPPLGSVAKEDPIDLCSPPSLGLFKTTRPPLAVVNNMPSPFLAPKPLPPPPAPPTTKPPTLTDEQRQRIEQNRQAALRRRHR